MPVEYTVGPVYSDPTSWMLYRDGLISTYMTYQQLLHLLHPEQVAS